MIVEIVRFKDGLSMQRYACRITDNGKVRYCRIHNTIPTYFEIDEFGVIPANVLTSFKVANGCKEILDNFRNNQAEVVTPEMVQTESLLGMHEDGKDVREFTGITQDAMNTLRINSNQDTLNTGYYVDRPSNIFEPLLVDRANKPFDPGNL